MARRGGWRPRRYVVPGDVPVWVSSGRWGPKRAHVEQCPVVLRAEQAYTDLLRSGVPVHAGWRGTLGSPADTSWRIDAEVLPNAVWRRGRLFFRCSACGRRATRLYVPVLGQPLRCRRCWGLSYESQGWSYSDTGFMAHILGGSRLVCQITTQRKREERRAAAERRYAERRRFLVRPLPVAEPSAPAGP